jgi:hypothetical protein
MHQFPHRQSSSSNTGVLVGAALGLGVVLVYALASPRRRAALSALGHSALDAGSRLASTSAERLQEWMPGQLQEGLDRFSSRAAATSSSLTSTATDRLHNAVDVASQLLHQAVARARGTPQQAVRGTRAALRHSDSGYGRALAVGPVMAAAAIGAGIYAMRRYRGNDPARNTGRDGAAHDLAVDGR